MRGGGRAALAVLVLVTVGACSSRPSTQQRALALAASACQQFLHASSTTQAGETTTTLTGAAAIAIEGQKAAVSASIAGQASSLDPRWRPLEQEFNAVEQIFAAGLGGGASETDTLVADVKAVVAQ
jgi:hypothetical protein